MPEVTWDALAAHALRRQFPEPPVRTPGVADVVDLLQRVGPLQTQNARAAFIGIAARLPGVTHEVITAAYEEHRILRGSNLRGTVHTSTAADHPLLEATTRIGQRALYHRYLRPVATSLDEIFAGIEDYARDEWRTPAQLREHLGAWMSEHDPEGRPQLETTAGRYFGFGHGGLVRRPLSGPWSGQGAPGYRTASALLAAPDSVERTRLLADSDAAVETMIRRHLTAYGPASRNDIAWWSGVGLTPIDAGLQQLAAALHSMTGPDGRTYVTLTTPAAPSDAAIPEIALLPEFDALLCGFDPPARARFVDPRHYDILWRRENGLLLAPLLVRGRLTGYWTLAGAGGRRDLTVAYFRGTPRPTRSLLAAPVAGIERALAVRVGTVAITRHS